MKIFCDTSVLIAAFVASHPHHQAALPVIERVKAGADDGSIAAHSLAEGYAVLTRLPGAHQVPASMAWQLIQDNIIKHFALIALSAKEYLKTLEDIASRGVLGGPTYDALLLTAAAKCEVERIYTFNVRHFRDLAHEDIRPLIMAP